MLKMFMRKKQIHVISIENGRYAKVQSKQTL